MSIRNTAGIRSVCLSVVLICLTVPLIYFLQVKLEEMVKSRTAEEDILYITPGKYLKPLVLGYDVAVADILWLRAVQYVGEKKPSAGTYKWLYPLADTITTLDPRFDMVYHTAGIVLSTYAKPQRLEESVAIFKKGVVNSPDTWRHPFYLSFIYWYYLEDYKAAAEYMAMAAAKPGHPVYTEKLAARLYAEAKDPNDGILFLSQVIENTRDEKVKKDLEGRLIELVTERDLLHLEDAVKAYKEKTGKRPAALPDLVAAGIVGQLPKEPGGGYYYLDADGAVKSSRMKERLRIYGKEKK